MRNPRTAAEARLTAARDARALTTVYVTAGVAALGLLLFTARGPHPALIEQAFGLVNVPVAPSLLSVVVLALTARALMARKRVGLLIAEGFQVVGMLVGATAFVPRTSLGWMDLWQSRTVFGRGLDAAAILTGAAAVWWMWRLRDAFPGRLRVRHAHAAAGVAVAGSALTVIVTAGMIEATEVDGASPAEVARTVLAAVGGITRVGPLGPPAWLIHVTAALVAVTILAAAAVLLQPAPSSASWTPDREVSIRALLQRYGGADSLGYLATRRDRHATFAPDGRAVVTSRAIAGVSLAGADPVGEREAWGAGRAGVAG